MSEFLLAAAGFVLAMVALGLIRILRGPKRADRMMAAQLLGTGALGRCCWLLAADCRRWWMSPLRWPFWPLLPRSYLSRAQGLASGRIQIERGIMRFALDVFTIVAVSSGAFFFLAGTVGLLRFPDTLTRLHALTKADNLGLGLIVLGLLSHVPWPFVALKLIAVWVLVLVASACASQLVARQVKGDRGS